jgi:hypothetical protein
MASGSEATQQLRPETNKRPGVVYAFTRDGVELPVVDVTHPVFAIRMTESEQQSLVEKFLSNGVPLAKLPKALREIALRFLLRQSALARGIDQARGSFMSGLQTYLFKLGAEMLGSAYTKPIDRQIAAALPSFCVRLRLQDMAGLIAETLLPLISDDPRRPLRLLNIAGGPAMDSLNALILLHRKCPGILAQRAVAIDVLDLDGDGPDLEKQRSPLYRSRVDRFTACASPSDTSSTTGRGRRISQGCCNRRISSTP